MGITIFATNGVKKQVEDKNDDGGMKIKMPRIYNDIQFQRIYSGFTMTPIPTQRTTIYEFESNI